MTPFGRNFIVSITLAITDLISFIISLYLAIGILNLTASNSFESIHVNQIKGWVFFTGFLHFVVLLGTQSGLDIIFIVKRFGLN